MTIKDSAQVTGNPAVKWGREPDGRWLARCGCGWSQAYNSAGGARRQAVWHGDITGHAVDEDLTGYRGRPSW